MQQCSEEQSRFEAQAAGQGRCVVVGCAELV